MKQLAILAIPAAVAATLAGASPAYAGTCPAMGNFDMSNAPSAPVGVTDEVLSTVDLGPEIGVDGRQLRTRRLVVQPGGVVPMHSHVDRPALIITISGSITEYRSNCSSPITHNAGEISREAEGISHYWINNGTEPAVLLSSDVFHAM